MCHVTSNITRNLQVYIKGLIYKDNTQYQGKIEFLPWSVASRIQKPSAKTSQDIQWTKDIQIQKQPSEHFPLEKTPIVEPGIKPTISW